MKREILTNQDTLHEESLKIDFDKDSQLIQEIIQDLKDTLSKTPTGVGLAAPQIGYGYRIFIMKPFAHQPALIFINPSFIIKNPTRISTEEGCLSCPEYFNKNIKRYKTILAIGISETGKPIKKMLTDFSSIVFQHELDHLNGTLIIDYG